MDGIFNIYKEKGFTSHDVVAIIRKIINQKKVGHTGTLDPEAEGVLPVCVGKATKLVDYIMGGSKSYRADIIFGKTTTTQDHTGEVLEIREVDFDKEKIYNAVNSFIGEYFQIPPMYSAIKINGKKLYEIARQGKEIERKARKVEIFDIKIKSFEYPNKITIDVNCSKGTYIRTLCADIGEYLGCGAYMSSLIRTSSGIFDIKSSIKLDELKSLNDIDNVIIPMENVLYGYNKIYISQKINKLLYNGGRIYKNFFDKVEKELILDENVLVYDFEKNLIGIYIICKDENNIYIKPIKMLI